MLKYTIFWLLLTFGTLNIIEEPISSLQQTDPKTPAEKIANADWEIYEVSDEITWKYEHFEDLFDSKQSVTVLEVDLFSDDVKVVLPHVGSGFIKTSETAEKSGASAAINGSFFDTKIGGSVVFLKSNDSIFTKTREGFNSHRENAGFTMNDKGEISVVGRPEKGWESLEEYSTVLTSGPLLMLDKEVIEQVDQPFNANRHPRTAVGLTADNKLISVVVDGRNSQAHGMSIGELTELMKALGCVEAMNLDGGGSSTAWVKDHGVVNYPSDNKLFDHQGERAVANALCFILDN